MILPGWHPVLVHLPLAAVLLAVLLFATSWAFRDLRLANVLNIAATVNLVVGAAGTLLAVLSGFAAMLDLDLAESAHQAVARHLRWAIFTTLAVVLLAVWRGAGTAPEARPSPLFVLLLSLATAALLMTGLLGLQNVFRFGVGVLH
jgi:uncharacterized membrane protein